LYTVDGIGTDLCILQYGYAAPKQQQLTGADPTASTSLRTPIVVKDLSSYHNASKPHLQDASLVETHLTSKMRAVPQGKAILMTNVYSSEYVY